VLAEVLYLIFGFAASHLFIANRAIQKSSPAGFQGAAAPWWGSGNPAWGAGNPRKTLFPCFARAAAGSTRKTGDEE